MSKKIGELEDGEIDDVIRILDRHAKGNTWEAEAIAKMMISLTRLSAAPTIE